MFLDFIWDFYVALQKLIVLGKEGIETKNYLVSLRFVVPPIVHSLSFSIKTSHPSPLSFILT